MPQLMPLPETRQELLPAEIRAALPKMYATEKLTDEQKKIAVKLFNPCGSETWYVLEFDGDDTLFTWFVGGFCPQGELGYQSLSELNDLTLPIPGLYIERDEFFGNGQTTLAEVKQKRGLA